MTIYIFQFVALTKNIIANIIYTIGYCHFSKVRAIPERIITYVFYAIFYYHFFDFSIIIIPWGIATIAISVISIHLTYAANC